MGRAMLIIVTSLFFVFTITQVNTLRRQAEIGSLSNQFYHLNEARNAANAGVEMALADLKNGYSDANVSVNNTEVTYQIGDRSAVVNIEAGLPIQVEEPSTSEFVYGIKTSYRVLSTGKKNSAQAIVRVQAMSYQGMPRMDGALSLIGEGSTLKFGGNSATICGFDIASLPNLNKQQIVGLECIPRGSEFDKPGIATNFAETPTTYDLKGTDLDKVVKGNPPREVVDDSDVSFWLEFAKHLSANPTRVCTETSPCGFAATNDNSVTLVKSKSKLSLGSNDTYNGIILVESGGILDIHGTPTIKALILILGSGTKITGTPFIRGGIIFVNSGSDLLLEEAIDDVDGELGGNLKVFYDSSVIEQLITGHPTLTPRRFYTEFFID